MLVLLFSVAWTPAQEATGVQEAVGTYEELVQIFEEIRELDLTKMSDLSEDAFNQRTEKIMGLRERYEIIVPKGWPKDQQIDHQLVHSALSQVLFEHAVSRPWRRDPGFYVDRLSRIPFADVAAQGESLVRLRNELERVPRILEWGRANLTEAGGELARLAMRNLEKADGVGHGHPYREVPPAGVIGWFEDLRGRVAAQQPDLLDLVDAALRSTTEFRDWLKENADQMTGPSGVGLRGYNHYLNNVLLMPFTAQEVHVTGNRELERALAALALEKERNRGLPELAPAASEEEYKDRIREADRHIREFIRSKQILTIPDFVGEFGHNVPWIVRPGGLNFWEQVQYRDPRPDHVHAVIPGHRFDALLHSRDERPIRGRFSDSGRVEGWGLYLEAMMLQMGLLDEHPRTRELFYLFEAARAIRNRVELGLQTDQITVEQAVRDMVTNIPWMDEDVARVDCEIYLKRPGYGSSYLMGKVQIEELLAAEKKRLGDEFKLKDFHDRFLQSGWIPISMIRWEMTDLTDQLNTIYRRRFSRQQSDQ